jgi:hypothetical protein
MRLSMLSVAVVALLAPMASAEAMPPARAGLLECQGGRNVGLVLGSIASLDCVFRSGGRRPEAYIATVRRLGLDLGVTQSTKMTWAVNGPSDRLERGELAGTYGGLGANASMGVGGAAAQRPGPDRVQCCSRRGRPRAGAALVRSAESALAPLAIPHAACHADAALAGRPFSASETSGESGTAAAVMP